MFLPEGETQIIAWIVGPFKCLIVAYLDMNQTWWYP